MKIQLLAIGRWLLAAGLIVIQGLTAKASDPANQDRIRFVHRFAQHGGYGQK